MRTNQKMQRFLADGKLHETALSTELSGILISGFVEDNGCVFLAAEARNSKVTRDDLHDDTGYECFINHQHIKTLAEALEFARRLKSALAARFSDRFVIIVGFDGHEATVHFHKHRPGQAWISDDLEGYLEEGIAVFD